MILAYPFSWLPVALVVTVVVLLNAYLALLALAALALLALATTIALVWLAATELTAYGRRRLSPSRGADVTSGSAGDRRLGRTVAR